MNVQKFFNKKLRNPKSAYGLGKLFSKTKPYSPRIGRRIKETPTLKKLLSIHKKVKSIENLLGGIGKLDAKIIGVQDKAEKDKKKEKKKGKKSDKLFGGIIERPKTGFLDVIRNFVTYTFLGWLFTFLQPHLDKMQFILPVIQTAFDVMIFILKNILGGIGNTLKAFYFAKDNITGAIDKVKEAASGIQKTFDDTLVALQDVVNGTIEVVNSFIESTGEKFDKVETVDAGTIPPLPEVPKFDDNTSSFSAPTQPPNTLPPGIPVKAAATGGRIDPSTPVTRGIQPEERRDSRPLFKPSIQEQKSEPGKDVGGIDKVKDLYKSSTSGSGFSLGFFTISPTNEKDGFLALNKVSKELKINKSDDFLGLGNFMGASVDVALGQKPDKRTYQQFASGINYLVNYGINNPEAFQKMNLERMIETMVNSKVDVAINKIREEINKRSTTETPGDGESAPSGGGGGTAGGEYGGYAPSGIQKEIYDYLINEKKLSDVQALGLMANIARESSFRLSALGDSGRSIGLFQWKDARATAMKKSVPDWETNWKGQIDYALREPEYLSLVSPGEYQSTTFSSAQEAADWWMRRWERPRDTASGSKKHEEYLKNVPRAPDGSAKFREPKNSFLTISPGKIPKADYIKGVLDESGEPGFDVTWRGNNNIAVLPGRVKEVGQLYGANYGNVVVVESIDPVTGKKVDVMYAHFPTGGISVREGQQVSTGQVLGRMGKPGERGIGNITGQHASIDFYTPNTQRGQIIGRYSRWQQLSKEIISSAQTGNIPKNWPKPDSTIQQQPPTPQQQPSTPTSQQRTPQALQRDQNFLVSLGRIPFKVDGEEFYVVASADGEYRAYRKGNDGEINISGRTNMKYQEAIRKKIRELLSKRQSQSTSRNSTPSSFTVGGFTYETKVVNGRRVYTENGKPITEKLYRAVQKNHPSAMKKGGLVYEQNNNPLFPPQTYASYNEPQMMAKVFIQPVIVEASKSSTPSGIMFPSINLNSSKSPKLIKQ